MMSVLNRQQPRMRHSLDHDDSAVDFGIYQVVNAANLIMTRFSLIVSLVEKKNTEFISRFNVVEFKKKRLKKNSTDADFYDGSSYNDKRGSIKKSTKRLYGNGKLRDGINSFIKKKKNDKLVYRMKRNDSF